MRTRILRVGSDQTGGVPSANLQLFRHYLEQWPRFGALLPTDTGFSVPLLGCETCAYPKAKVRLVVVGQQTRHWLRETMGPWSQAHFSPKACAPETIQKLMCQYAAFLGSDQGKGRGFFRAARQIQRAIDPWSGSENAFLWRNLFISDQEGREPAEEFHDRLRALSPLVAELRILRPDVVVFMTGQRFDFTLRAILGRDAVSLYSSEVDVRNLARVTIPDVPAFGLRIPHPRNPRQAIWVREAIQAIRRELDSKMVGLHRNNSP